MRGTESSAWLRSGTQAVRIALPNATMVELKGQNHSAMITAPEYFAEKVVQFVCALDRSDI
jgi:pimeloyl-ACP methyl ester carboxylesterase